MKHSFFLIAFLGVLLAGCSGTGPVAESSRVFEPETVVLDGSLAEAFEHSDSVETEQWFLVIDQMIRSGETPHYAHVSRIHDLLDQLPGDDGENVLIPILDEWTTLCELFREREWPAEPGLEDYGAIRHWLLLNLRLVRETGLVQFADEAEQFIIRSDLSRLIRKSELAATIYTRKDDLIFVHLYGYSAVNYQHTTGGQIRLIQESDYPAKGVITLKVEADDKRYMTIRLRIPHFALHASLTAGGVKYPANPGRYAQIARKWKTGDELQLVLLIPGSHFMPPAEP